MTTDSELKCPLCGGKQTNFHDVYSDGDEVVKCSFRRQQCVSCGLPCKFWDRLAALSAEVEAVKKMRANAERIAGSLPKESEVDVDKWASKLANDVKDSTD